MPVSLTANGAAGVAMRTLDTANRNLTSSLKRLSTGNRIANTYDDAAGEAVQLKMKASISRYDTAKTNIQNAISFLEVQDGFLQTAVNLVSRMGDLRALADDPSKSSDDIANYQEEFNVLHTQLTNLDSEKFNDSALFGVSGSQQIFTSEQGSANTSASVVMFSGGDTAVVTQASSNVAAAANTGANAITGISTSAINQDLQALVNLRARNGAYQSVLNYAYDNASTAKTNLEAARSRITDVDIAEESGKFARAQIKTQAAASMLAQANNIGANTLLQLLG